MRIMVFMKDVCQDSAPQTKRTMKTPTFSATQSASIWPRVRWTFCALACVCLVTSAQATVTTRTLQHIPTDRSDLQLSPNHSTALNTSSAGGSNATSDPGRNDRASFNESRKFTLKLPLLSQMNALCPLVGLLAAIGFTHILRRRRIAQLEAIGISQR